MYKLIQKNQKKFLAFFGVLLMIVFILPTSFKNSMNRGDNAIGTLYGEKIYGRDLAEAKNDIELLREYRFPPLFTLGGEGQIAAEFHKNDDGALAYLLLQREAQKAGISIADQDVENLITESYQKGQLSPSDVEQITHAVGRFMLVQAGFERASDAVKVTTPLLQYWLAQVYQKQTLNLVEYRADEFAKTVPEPTPEQVRQQYEKYADVPPPVGYKVPDRVKLQYLELTKSAVVESVLNDLTGPEKFDLDIQGAYPYYAQHPDEFKAPPPASSLILGPSTQPTQPSPTTKPFDAAVKLDLEKRLLSDPTLSSADAVVALRARVAAREMVLRDALQNELHSAYLDWTTHSAGSTTAPSATQPATTNPIAATYPELDFLTAFATRFEAQYKVRPLVNSLANKWLTAEDLNSLPGISSARNGQTPFADYAMHDLAPAPATEPVSTTSTSSLLADSTTAPATNAATTQPVPLAAAIATGATTSPATMPAGQRFTVEDFARVDPEMADLLKARGEAQRLYNSLVAEFGPKNPAVQTSKAALDSQTAHVQAYCDQLNDRFAIRWNADGTGGTLVPKSIAGQIQVAATAPSAPTNSWAPLGTGLRPFEPSQVLDDSRGNSYIFRLTAFEPTHRPALAEVQSQIVAQLKLTAADQRARDEAKKLLANAQIETKLRKEKKAVDLQGLPAAAKASGRTLITTMGFQAQELSIEHPVPGYDPRDFEDKALFIDAIIAFCKQQTPDNLHPSTVIELPGEHKVVVAELGEPTLPMPLERLGRYTAIRKMLQGTPDVRDDLLGGRFVGVTAASSMLDDWFNLDNIISRVKYEKISKG